MVPELRFFLKSETDTPVRHAVVGPVHGVEIEYLLFGRISHNIIEPYTQEQQFVVVETVFVAITGIDPVVERGPFLPKLLDGIGVEGLFVDFEHLARPQQSAHREGGVGAQRVGDGSVQLVGNIVERRELAVGLQFVEPFAAAGIGVGELQQPVVPVVVEIAFDAVAVAVTGHDVVTPLGILDEGFGSQCHDVTTGLVVTRHFEGAVAQVVFPACLVVFRRTGLVRFDTGHSEIGGQKEGVEPQVVVELLHAGEAEVEEVAVPRRVFEREAGLNAVIVAMLLGQVADEMDTHLREEAGGDANEVVVEDGELVDGLVTHAHAVAENGQVVDLVVVFGPPAGRVDVVVAVTEFGRDVHRLDAAVNIVVGVGFESQHIGIGDVFVRGIENRGGVAQLSFREVVGQLVDLVVPSQNRNLLFGSDGQPVVVAGVVGQGFERTRWRDVVRQFGIEVECRVVEAVLLRQELVEQVEPAAPGAHQVGEFVFDNGTFEHDRRGRHVEREGAHVFLLVAVFEVHLGNRREFPLQLGGEEPFVEDDVFHRVAVEHGQHEVEVPRVIDRHAVEQELILVIPATVDQKVVAGGDTGHARQNPYLREQVVAVERQHARRCQFVERIAQLLRLYGDLVDFIEKHFEPGGKGEVPVGGNRLFVGLVAHAGDDEAILPFGQGQFEASVLVGEGVLPSARRVVERDDGSVEFLAAPLLVDGSREGEELLLPDLYHQFARRYDGGLEGIIFQQDFQEFPHSGCAGGLEGAHLVEVDGRGVIGEGDATLLLDLVEPL